GKRVVFTGSFRSRKRRELETEAAARGAVIIHEIGFTTDFLFYGEGAEDSIRFKKAELLKEQGAQLKILNEDGLLELLA
ncbi:MAG: BRCT domain-containing protein, partial [Lachnospiraceae bacterium]|nr:BRCT domain-containing protein [Lachnospiraceae bacterium]